MAWHAQGGPTYLDVITYYHHAGLVCAAVKDFARAKRFFSIVSGVLSVLSTFHATCSWHIQAVAVPTATASAIQLAAAKRAILCGLIDNGEVSPASCASVSSYSRLDSLQKLLSFPRYTSGTITRMIDRNAKEYTKLGKAFESHDWKIVREAAASKEFAEVSDVTEPSWTTVDFSGLQLRSARAGDELDTAPKDSQDSDDVLEDDCQGSGSEGGIVRPGGCAEGRNDPSGYGEARRLKV
jgi:hypothetical protein